MMASSNIPGPDLSGLFGQPRNLIRPRFWSMLADLVALLSAGHRSMPTRSTTNKSASAITLAIGGYGDAFRDDHLLPMASAIWSASPAEILSYPSSGVHPLPR